MKISIAMASYNGARFLDEQLRSLACQTRLPHELVITDDGSTDDTVQIINRFAQQAPFPVRLYRNENRLGFADNFLKAATLCQGDWVAFCDQDDVWLPNKLQRCAQELSDQSVIFVVHSGVVVNQELQPLGWQVPGIKTRSIHGPLCGDPWGVYAGFATMIRRDVLTLLNAASRPAHPFFPGTQQPHDRWTYFLASVFGSTAMVPDQLVLYRQHSTNTYGVRKPSTFNGLGFRVGSSSDFLARCIQAAAEHASILEAGLREMPYFWKQKAAAGVTYYRDLQRYLERRAVIHNHDCGLGGRISAFIKNVLQGGYRSIQHGGLGSKAFLKDTVMSIAGPLVLNKISRIKSRDHRLHSN